MCQEGAASCRASPVPDAASVDCPPGSTMLLRETSLMPHIPGLPALLSVLFAPVIELRCGGFVHFVRASWSEDPGGRSTCPCPPPPLERKHRTPAEPDLLPALVPALPGDGSRLTSGTRLHLGRFQKEA